MKPIVAWLVAFAVSIPAPSAIAQVTDRREPSVYSRGAPMRIDSDVESATSNRQASSDPRIFPTLTPKSAEASDVADNGSIVERNQLAAPAITVTSSLAVVLALFAAMVWVARKYGSRSFAPGAIPKDVIQSLGTTAIDSRTRVTMLRCGSRILVLAQTPSGVHPLSEINDPDEVRRLTAACIGDSKRNFTDTLQSIENEKPATGFLDEPATTPRSRGRLFATA